MTNINDRKKDILRAVVELYVETAEPVGSKAVAQKLGSSISSATIRNEMAELESAGLLEQPHTSAGRIPSSQGYRIYVDELMRRQKISTDDAQVVNNVFKSRETEQTRLLDEAGGLASRLTTYPAYAMASATGTVSIVRFDLIYVDAHTFIIVTLLSNDSVKNKLIHLTSPVMPQTRLRFASILHRKLITKATRWKAETATASILREASSRPYSGTDIGRWSLTAVTVTI